MVTLSSKNQVTLPVSLLSVFGMEPKDKFLVEKKSDVIILKPVKGYVTDKFVGALAKYIPKNKKGESWEKIMTQTRKKVARHLVEDD